MRKKMMLLVLTGVLIISGCTHKESGSNATDTEITENIEKIKESDYVVDTAYTGADVPFVLYETAFQKSGTYVKNTELLKTVPDAEVTEYIKTATSYVNTIYGNSYISILEEQDAFMMENIGAKHYIGFYNENAEKQVTMNDLLELYVDNTIDANADLKTDKSLFYEDMYNYILRGAMTITVYEEDACEAYGEFFGLELSAGTPQTFVCEIYFVPGDTTSIVGFEILSD